MKARYIVVLSTLAGVAIGAATIQTLHAQAKPPVYMVAINELTNPDGIDATDPERTFVTRNPSDLTT